jgi:hypothetical protein
MAVNDQTLDHLLSAVEQEITLSSRRIEDASRSGDEWFLEAVTDDECDRIEQLLGWAFVAAQTFITTVRSRLARLSDMCSKNVGKHLSFISTPKAHEVLKLADPMRNVPRYTEIEVINAVANYWKHQEEWPTRIEPKDEYAELVWNQDQMRNNEKLTVDSIVVICHAGTPMLPLGQAEYADQDKGVYDGTADSGACSCGYRAHRGLPRRV